MSRPEAALFGSPLGKLPPEVRGIIYSFLLTQPHEVLISYKRFRSQYDKIGLFPNNCMHCSRAQGACKCNDFALGNEFYYQHQPLPRLTISTGILSTCHLIYDEAAPLLYKQNLFHFADPTAFERLQIETDRKHNHKIERLILTTHSTRREVYYSWEKTLSRSRSLDLAEYFPALKNIVFRLRGQFELLDDQGSHEFCESLARMLQCCLELQWVHVNGLTDADAIMEFAPVIERPKSNEMDEKEVRTHHTDCWSREGWHNATIWWGNDNEKPPYTPPFQKFDLRVKRVLQRGVVSGSKNNAVEVVLPYVSGPGGMSGSWGFM